MRAEDPRRPVELGIEIAERAGGAAERARQEAADALLGHEHPVAAIAGEGLVGAVARERDLDRLAGELGHAVGGQRRGVGERLVEGVGEHVDQAEIAGGDDAAAVTGGEPLGDLGRMMRLVMVGLVEADRAGLDRLAARLGHEGDHRRAVDAAGEEGAERHVGDHARADGGAQPLDHFLLERLQRRTDGAGEVDVPPLHRPRHRPAAADEEVMAGGQLPHALDDRAIVGDVAVGEISPRPPARWGCGGAADGRAGL